jgi:hypothetical protein
MFRSVGLVACPQTNSIQNQLSRNKIDKMNHQLLPDAIHTLQINLWSFDSTNVVGTVSKVGFELDPERIQTRKNPSCRKCATPKVAFPVGREPRASRAIVQ